MATDWLPLADRALNGSQSFMVSLPHLLEWLENYLA
jgi:hypothetical protein